MVKEKIIMVGHEEIAVDDKTYNAANREMERVKKKRQRLRRDGIEFEEKSLDEMYENMEYEPAAEDDSAETAIKNVLIEQFWKAINEALDETDSFIVTAYYRDKLSESKIGKILNMTQQGVSKRRKKAEGQLRHVLEDFRSIFE
jgi:RNA polymerase sigma factor (sigma-70 family)